MSLVLSKREDQTWRDAAIEQARRYGMERDVTEYFDRFIAAGDDEAEAAWSACYEWDVLDYRPTHTPEEATETWDISADPACAKPGDGFSINETEAAFWK